MAEMIAKEHEAKQRFLENFADDKDKFGILYDILAENGVHLNLATDHSSTDNAWGADAVQEEMKFDSIDGLVEFAGGLVTEGLAESEKRLDAAGVQDLENYVRELRKYIELKANENVLLELYRQTGRGKSFFQSMAKDGIEPGVGLENRRGRKKAGR